MMTMRRLLTLLSFALCFAAAALPARADDVLAAPGQPAWTRTYGNLTVARYGGNGGPALILVPGLSSGPWTWYDFIRRDAGKHAIYAVTVAGMDGVPVDPTPSLTESVQSIVALIAGEKIDRPVLIGHSMGGSIALRFGTQHAALVRGVVSVDGMPVFPGTEQLTPDQRAASAKQAAERILATTPDQYASYEKALVADYVTDPALAARVATLCLLSDQKAVAAYFKDLFAEDLRAQLPSLAAPTLVVSPVPGLPLPSYLPAAMAQMTLDQRRVAAVQYYSSLMIGTPTVKVVPIDNARHFVMLDQPEAFAQAVETFVDGLK